MVSVSFVEATHSYQHLNVIIGLLLSTANLTAKNLFKCVFEGFKSGNFLVEVGTSEKSKPSFESVPISFTLLECSTPTATFRLSEHESDI